MQTCRASSGKLRKPVIGNVDPPRDPGVPSVGDMPKNSVEGSDAAGPADYSQVQPDRHHLRGMRPFAMQPVEGVDRISGEIGGAAEPVGMENCMSLVSNAYGSTRCRL